MFYAFFESVKHVGHLLPVALLRVFMGYYFLNLAFVKIQSDYLIRPRLVSSMVESLPQSIAPDWYRSFIEFFVIPNWQFFAYLLTGLELAIAMSFILGYLVRPLALMGAFLSLNYLLLSSLGEGDLHRIVLVIHLTFAWLGAGRCLGFDYFFFKRRRGIWW